MENLAQAIDEAIQLALLADPPPTTVSQFEATTRWDGRVLRTDVQWLNQGHRTWTTCSSPLDLKRS